MNDEEFKVTLVQFKTNVIANYGSCSGDVEAKVHDIQTWVNEQRADANNQRISDNISGVGTVLQTSIASIEDLASGDPANVMKGCLNIAGSVAAMVAGPYGAAAGAVCGILGSVLSLTSSRQPDITSVFIKIVRAQLQEFNQKQKSEKFEGLQLRVRNMNAHLKGLKSVESSQSAEKAAEKDIPDQVLLETDFPQFIGEVSENFMTGFTLDSEQIEKDQADCVKSILMYCNAQALFLVLLTNVLAKYKATGRDAQFAIDLIDQHKEEAKKTLGFLSDVEALAHPSNPRDGKAMMALALRGDKSGPYKTVAAFRESLGMTEMLSVESLKGVVFCAALPDMPESTTHKYPQPQMLGKHHHFQFINETDLPVKVVCGTAGWPANKLTFIKDVPPRSSYEHAATSWFNWTFSTGGYFIVYLDGEMRSDEDRFEADDIKVFEFALANPLMGAIKSNLMDKTAKVATVNGEDCWKAINKAFECLQVPLPTFFVHTNKEKEVKKYVVSTGVTSFYFDFPGKNGCRTWRYRVQVFE